MCQQSEYPFQNEDHCLPNVETTSTQIIFQEHREDMCLYLLLQLVSKISTLWRIGNIVITSIR